MNVPLGQSEPASTEDTPTLWARANMIDGSKERERAQPAPEKVPQTTSEQPRSVVQETVNVTISCTRECPNCHHERGR
jgi:hypothetical protein